MKFVYLSFSNERTKCAGRPKLKSSFKDGFASAWHENDGGAVQKSQSRQNREQNEPEPEEDEDLLVDDVQSKHTHGVQLLNRSGSTVFVEGALGDPWEDRHHRVRSQLLVHVAEPHHVRSVTQKRASQKRVDEKDVTNLKNQKHFNFFHFYYQT